MDKDILHKEKAENGKTCIIISSGTEITEGIRQDLHLEFLGRELKRLGISVLRACFLPDEAVLFRNELENAVRDCDIVIITGGLGPTSDDLTRETVAEITGKKLVFDQASFDALQRRLGDRPVQGSNLKQAYIPEGFSSLDNKEGTACGFAGKTDRTMIIALPGPPRELQPMFLDSVIPLIAGSDVPEKKAELVCSAYMIPESRLEDAFQKIIKGTACMRTACMRTRLEKDRIVFTLYNDIPDVLASIAGSLADFFGIWNIRTEDAGIAETVFSLLKKEKKKIVFAESCTGGLLAEWMTDIPGSSEVFWGSFVTYANQAKIACLDVDPHLIDEKGAVSGEVVSAMTAGALAKSGVDICIAVSGIAGPDGGSPEKPVGTVWIGIRTKGGYSTAKSFRFSGNRTMIRRKTAIAGYLIIESILSGKNILDIPENW